MDQYQHLLHPRMTPVVQDASFWRRACAFIFDILIIDIIVTAPLTPVFEPMMRRMEITSITAMTYTNMEIAAIMLIFVIAYAYFVLFEYLLTQTPGMMLLNTRTHGKSGIMRMLIRNSFMLPFFPFIILWVIEPFAITFWKRSVLEHLSDTRTVHQRNIML